MAAVVTIALCCYRVSTFGTTAHGCFERQETQDPPGVRREWVLSSLREMRVCERSVHYQRTPNEDPVFGPYVHPQAGCFVTLKLSSADVPMPGGRTQQEMNSALCLALS